MDAGYASYDNLEYIEEKETDAYIPDNKLKSLDEKQEQDKRYDKSNFSYDEDSDHDRCPEGKTLTPDTKTKRKDFLDSLIRTCYVVKYLNGVEFFSEKIQPLCKKLALPCDVSFEAKEEGYYAAHLYAKQEFEIPELTWKTKRIKVSIELQITTQLQEVIRRLLHKYYEKRRVRTKEEEVIKCQWNYKSDEFAANYLGHILHYLEGIIMEIREKQLRRR